MTCAGRSRSPSLALPVSARTCRTSPIGNVLAITPRLMWSLTRMPAGKPAAARAIAANPARDSRQRTSSVPLTEQHWGLPRRINLLVARLLVHGAIEQRESLAAVDARELARELEREQAIYRRLPGE